MRYGRSLFRKRWPIGLGLIASTGMLMHSLQHSNITADQQSTSISSSSSPTSSSHINSNTSNASSAPTAFDNSAQIATTLPVADQQLIWNRSPHNVIVVGSGIIGITTAYYLAQRGHNVTVLDKLSEPASGCSFANAGWLCSTHNILSQPKSFGSMSVEAIRQLIWPSLGPNDYFIFRASALSDSHFYRWAMHVFRATFFSNHQKRSDDLNSLLRFSQRCTIKTASDEKIGFSLVSSGAISVYHTKEEFERAKLALQPSNSEFVALSADEVVQLEPCLSALKNEISGGILDRELKSGSCRAFALSLVERCLSKYSVKFRFNTKIDRVLWRNSNSGDRSVSGLVTDSGDVIPADAIVFCTGSESSELIQQLFNVYVPVYPVKGYSLTLDIPREALESAPKRVLVDEHTHLYATYFPAEINVDGSVDEVRFASFGEVGARKNTHIVYPDLANRLMSASQRFLPQTSKYVSSKMWCGARPWSADDLPIVSRLDPISNVYVSVGHGVLGWSLACGSAYMIAQMVDNKPVHAVNSDAFSVSRFRWWPRLFD